MKGLTYAFSGYKIRKGIKNMMQELKGELKNLEEKIGELRRYL